MRGPRNKLNRQGQIVPSDIRGLEKSTTYRGDNKFPCKQADSWKDTISNKRQGSEGVDSGVDISQSFQTFQSSSISVPKRAMPTKTNFHRSKCPSQDLIQTIGQVDGGRTLECRSGWHAINRTPAPAMHLEACENILGN